MSRTTSASFAELPHDLIGCVPGSLHVNPPPGPNLSGRLIWLDRDQGVRPDGVRSESSAEAQIEYVDPRAHVRDLELLLANHSVGEVARAARS